MLKTIFSRIVIVGLVGGLMMSATLVFAQPARPRRVVWEASVLPCTPAVCGGFSQNVATLTVDHGKVTVFDDGKVWVELENVRVLASGALAANKTLEALFGSFTTLVTEHTLLGTITTTAGGDYAGPIEVNGSPFVFAPGSMAAGNFVFNESQVRSEFTTGFVIANSSPNPTRTPPPYPYPTPTPPPYPYP